MLKNVICLLMLVGMLSACSPMMETGKKVWGSSVETLQRQRISNSLSQKFNCSFDQCFDQIHSLGRTSFKRTTEDEDLYYVFQQDRVKGFIIVMGIKGNVDTTEVGIFLTENLDQTLTIEITSLSSSAKRKVAEQIFKKLNQYYSINS